MGLIWTLVIGLIVGALAKFFMPGDDPGGMIVTMLLGVAGAFVATFIGRALGFYDGSSAGILMSIIGAMILLFGYRAIRGRGAHAHRP